MYDFDSVADPESSGIPNYEPDPDPTSICTENSIVTHVGKAYRFVFKKSSNTKKIINSNFCLKVALTK